MRPQRDHSAGLHPGKGETENSGGGRSKGHKKGHKTHVIAGPACHDGRRKSLTGRDLRWWARVDSNHRPRDYESPALAPELRALIVQSKIPEGLVQDWLKERKPL